MNLAALIPGLLLGLAACAVIVYLLRILLKSVLQLGLRENLEKRKLRHKMELLGRARERFRQAAYQECHPLLREAVVLEHFTSSAALVERALEHNLTLLAMIISFSEKYTIPLSNLPIIEELLQTRAAISRAYLETSTTMTKLKRRRDDPQSKTPPGWALGEFAKKLKELKEKLAVNRRSLECEIDKLFQGISQGTSLGQVTYH